VAHDRIERSPRHSCTATRQQYTSLCADTGRARRPTKPTISCTLSIQGPPLQRVAWTRCLPPSRVIVSHPNTCACGVRDALWFLILFYSPRPWFEIPMMLPLCQSQSTSCGVQVSLFYRAGLPASLSLECYSIVTNMLPRSELTASRAANTPPHRGCFQSWIPNHSCSCTLASTTRAERRDCLQGSSPPNPSRTP
jgi:hypothetical protein